VEQKVAASMKTRIFSQRGVALVIVLAFLVLIAGIIIAFFSGITTERGSSRTAADSAAAQQLADSAVNIVMAQIVDATKGIDPSDSNSILSWASQPGMIRTFSVTGDPRNLYKLYSSDHMVVTGSDFKAATDAPAADWTSAANAGIYTDLNAPVLVADQNGIIKPDSSKSDTYSAVYPILDPFSEGLVDGFSMTDRPGFSGGVTLPDSSYDPTQAVAGKSANPAPMPTKWLYVLRDGKVTSPSAAKDGKLTIPGATSDNPVTGRIAFWADDDTSKVNINTASEGIYWDVPRVFSREDDGEWSGNVNKMKTIGMAICQPVQKEFQRYPGHPATTCLSPIFGHLGLPIPTPITTDTASQFDPYFAIAPRVVSGGSNAGTTLSGSSATPLVPDRDRLYASIDELMFTPRSSGQLRIPNTAKNDATTPNILTRSALQKAKFFLTAASNAPEVTLFNTPRVSIWPVWLDASKRTAYDNLAAFCGTIGGRNFFFTRSDARSSTADYNQRNSELYRYLQALTSRNIPGFGGNFLKKYPAGSSGATDRDQILTLIYDYIRCINLADSEPGATPYAPVFNVDPNDPYANPVQPSYVYTDSPNLFKLGAGEVVPIKIGATMGVGRCLTVVEADLLFYATGQSNSNPRQTNKFRAVLLLQFASPMQGMGGMRSSLKYTITGLDSFQVNPSGTGFQSLGLPRSGTNYIELSDIQTPGGRGIGGVEGPGIGLYALKGNNSDKSYKVLDYTGAGGPGKYPFCSATDIVFTPPAAPATIAPRSFAFLGGPITITLSTQDKNEVVQVIHLNFPNSSDLGLKIPDVVFGGSGDWTNFNNRLTFDALNNGRVTMGDLIKNSQAQLTQSGQTSRYATDTIIGVQPAGAAGNDPKPGTDPTAGDFRMIAPLQEVPDTRFRAHQDYMNTGGALTEQAHGLTTASGYPYLGSDISTKTKIGTFGKLVNVPNGYPSANSPLPVDNHLTIELDPYVPSRVGNAVARKDGGPGDWDTGIGNMRDGAYMNKPDEGDARLIAHPLDNTVPRYPYMMNEFMEAPPGAPYFSPNRQVPSPLMFGSIPTGVQRMLPWQTLLFHPTPEDPTHPGKASPPDHLLADLFWIPVVEPYAISQPFCTAGKINLNYQILPFTYIKRQTGLNAVMKATKFLAIPPSDSITYKPDGKNNEATGNTVFSPDRRRSIDIPTTLQAFDTKFASDQIYKSATEICELNLVPPGESQTSMASFWRNNNLTGDNVREKPYVDLYSRLTTKSNTYTVHVRVQALRQRSSNAAAGVFVDPGASGEGARDSIVSEYRGSTTIERYIDPNDPTLPDFATVAVNSASDPSLNIDKYYKFRVVGTKRFAP